MGTLRSSFSRSKAPESIFFLLFSHPQTMSSSPILELPAQGTSPSSGQMLPTRLSQSISDPSASKRVCFYKSGDYKFSGHRLVINARTFKSFDALLDALSQKVPLPFGVRTITTPRGTHLVKGLDELQDGGSYVCSDQRRVKPLDLDEVNRRQVPWNTTRAFSAVRQQRQRYMSGQFGRRSEVMNRQTKVTERVAVRTPKRLVVIKNKDPTIKRTIVLHRRTAPTFDALLDYLSQILQFPVLKLYSTDGRRVDGLASLILCSGIIVAAGTEPFRLANYNFHRMGQTVQAMYMDTVEQPMLQPQTQNKSFSSGRGSRNFSLSSERYIVNQINKSRSSFEQLHDGSFGTELNQDDRSMETCASNRVENQHPACIVPQDEDIEKSFRVNQDGSMTVEMKVRLTIKEEEMLHWTTTLSRSSLSKRTNCASLSELGNNSPESDNQVAKESSSISADGSRDENYPFINGKGVSFDDGRIYQEYTSTVYGKAKTHLKRKPTPGPRHVKKKASIESVTRVTESGVQESTLGHYSYMERTDRETAEEYCMVRHSSSKGRPVPKPRKSASAGMGKKGSSSSTASLGVAEVLQIQNDGMEITETVMHIYESQGCYDNYFANEEYSADGAGPGPPSSSESKPSLHSSSSTDCDLDLCGQPSIHDSRKRQKEEMLSLSSEPVSSAHQIPNNLSSVSENGAHSIRKSQAHLRETKNIKDYANLIEKTKKEIKSTRVQRSSRNESAARISKPITHHLPDKKHSSDASVGKKSLSSSESVKSGQRSKVVQMPQMKTSIRHKNESVLLVRRKEKNMDKATMKDNNYNVNTSNLRSQMKKKMADVLQHPKPTFPEKKTHSKPGSSSEKKLYLSKKSLEVVDSVSMPCLNPSPSDIHQYVESWLEDVKQEPTLYIAEEVTAGSEPQAKVIFQIGTDSESEGKNDNKSIAEENCPPSDGLTASTSCLTIPLCSEGQGTPLLCSEQKVKGLCKSMPSFKVEPVQQVNRIRSHKSAEAICQDNNQLPSAASALLSPTTKIKPVLQQLCSSIQGIRIEKSKSLPDFSSQVASVFGLPCKAFVSFLSVMTLRDSIDDSLPDGGPGTSSEAMVIMESLQKISAIEDQEEQRASLTDLRGRASSLFRERWKDFQILRERLESEPLSPKVSETEFALDVESVGGDAFEDQDVGIDELMEELGIPQDLRADISSTIHQAKSFYPVEESTFIETVSNHSEEDLEQFVKECDMSTQSVGSDQNLVNETMQFDNRYSPQAGEKEDDSFFSGMNYKQVRTRTTLEKEPIEDIDADISQTDKLFEERENVVEEKEERDHTDETEEDGQWREMIDGARETECGETDEEKDAEEKKHFEGEEEWEGGRQDEMESAEKEEEEEEEEDGTEEEDPWYGDEEMEKVEYESVEEAVLEDDPVAETVAREDGEETDTVEEEEEGGEAGKAKECITECENEEEVFEETDKEAEHVNEETEGDVEVESLKADSEGIIGEMHSDVENKSEEWGEEEGEEEEEEEEEGEGKGEGEGEEESVGKETDTSVEKKEIFRRDKTVVFSAENSEGEEEGELKRVQEDDDKDVTQPKSDEDSTVTNEEEEDGENYEMIVEEAKTDESEVHSEALERLDISPEEQSAEKELSEGTEADENIESVQSDEMERKNDYTDGDLSTDYDEQSNREVLEDHIFDETWSFPKSVAHTARREEVSYPRLQSSSLEEAKTDMNGAQRTTESPLRYSSEGRCEDDKGNGTDTFNETETDEGGIHGDKRSSVPHPVEISQDLLDFVNSALQSSSLICTFDERGNIRIEPDKARITKTKQTLIPKSRKNSLYGLKQLPSPNTSDLSDYRPESSESGERETQESVDLASQSGEEDSKRESSRNSVHRTAKTNVERVDSKLPVKCHPEDLQSRRLKSRGSFSSRDSGSKASREDLSYFRTARSSMANRDSAHYISIAMKNDSNDGILIDQGRWLLKENHLIRNSPPPVSQSMYSNLDSTSADTGQDNTSEESPSQPLTRHNPLTALSSSELEEMAKPQTLKCTYYNMPHGSDSDPFLDDASITSGKKDKSSMKGRTFRVSPAIDTSKNWANKNGSLSSFASVEFKMPDSKVHPEEQSAVVTQARRTSSARGRELQMQDSLDTLRVRCGQFCPIL